jgi:hypothetical protein
MTKRVHKNVVIERRRDEFIVRVDKYGWECVLTIPRRGPPKRVGRKAVAAR